LREVWKHEALGFTRWLQENIDVVNDALELSLVSVERERSAGDFSVDLVAEDESGNPVVIENQLEKSDYDHLGKLLTYLVMIGATPTSPPPSRARASPSKAATPPNPAPTTSTFFGASE
jgi:hypothetical protein